jgi:2-iminobutanoate/2-iminopropanoate deaminase
MKKVIHTKNAPAPIGPYSQAVMAGNTLYVSGQIGIDPFSGQLVDTDIGTETRQVMKNIGAILKENGMDFNNIIKSSVFLKDMNNFSVVNEIYGSYFSKEFPARETIQVSMLPKDMNVEISVIAMNVT